MSLRLDVIGVGVFAGVNDWGIECSPAMIGYDDLTIQEHTLGVHVIHWDDGRSSFWLTSLLISVSTQCNSRPFGLCVVGLHVRRLSGHCRR